MVRHYENYGVKDAAAKIVAECIQYGKSEGWCGGAMFDEVQEICNQYNVYYVSDFFGRWEHRKVK